MRELKRIDRGTDFAPYARGLKTLILFRREILGTILAVCPFDYREHYRSFIKEKPMLRWAIIFFVIAIIAAVLGFGGIAGAASGIATLLFYVFIILFVIGLIMHLVRKA